MKLKNLKRTLLIPVLLLSLITLLYAMTTVDKGQKSKKTIACCKNSTASHICVMKTILGIETVEDGHISSFQTPAIVDAAIKKGLDWIDKSQLADGGWGSGTHSHQDILDPHAVQSDPATTALVGMSLLRTENTLYKGKLSENLKKATEWLLKTVEQCPQQQQYLTTLTNTQPQIKLGRNIDVILTAQFFTNLLKYEITDAGLKKRIEKNLDNCIGRIQKSQENDGSWKDGGWAPVLQSALANNALESAQDVGRKVEKSILERSRKYQAGNFDGLTGKVATDRAAGVMLYSLSSTTRASAKDAKKAKEIIEKARKENKLNEVVVTANNLQKAGLSENEARNLASAYEINKAANSQALREDIMLGFGSNGGEEFLSYLMTGESMVMQGGSDWKKWYDMMTGKLVNIQNNDGSWNGHHCITSPVFCTATCLLILSIHNDMQFSIQQNENKKGF